MSRRGPNTTCLNEAIALANMSTLIWCVFVFVAFGSCSSNKAFGTSQEFSVEDLREYHYMFSMLYFEDRVELGEFESHNQALETIETNLRNSENYMSLDIIKEP